MNESVFINLGIAEFNAEYLNSYSHIKMFNAIISAILCLVAYKCLNETVSSTKHIRRLCLCLLIQHEPLIFMSIDSFTSLSLVHDMLTWIFYTYLFYFWMGQICFIAGVALQNQDIEMEDTILPKILSIVRNFIHNLTNLDSLHFFHHKSLHGNQFHSNYGYFSLFRIHYE